MAKTKEYEIGGKTSTQYQGMTTNFCVFESRR